MVDEYSQGYRWSVNVYRRLKDNAGHDKLTIYYQGYPTIEQIRSDIDQMDDLSSQSEHVQNPQPLPNPNYKTPLELARSPMPILVEYYNSLDPKTPAKRNTFKDKSTVLDKIHGMQLAQTDGFEQLLDQLFDYRDGQNDGLPYRFILLCLQAEYPDCELTLQDLQNMAEIRENPFLRFF